MLTFAEARDCEHSGGSALWHDALYHRDYRVLPKGRPGEWLRAPIAQIRPGIPFRIDIFCGTEADLIGQTALCRLLILDADGSVRWHAKLGESDFPSAPWGILSATGVLSAKASDAWLEIQGAGDTELRIQRIEVRQIEDRPAAD